MFEDVIDHFVEKTPVILMMPFLVILTLLVHELGHYMAARLTSMKVERVVIGFGKCLYSRTDKNGTDWFIHLWPFKAYVGIADFDAQKDKIWRRLFVVLAGPFASLILPFFVMASFFVFFGKPVSPAMVTGVELHRPAYEAGLRPGDKITSIDDNAITYSAQILPFTRNTTDRALAFGIETNGVSRRVDIKPELRSYREENGFVREHGVVGVLMMQLPYDYGALDSVDGIKINGKDDAHDDMARNLIYERLGKTATIGLKSEDRKIYEYLVDLPRESNPNMMDEKHDDYDYFFIGRLRDNYYLPLGFAASLREAASRDLELIRNVAKTPFNLFPINKEWLLEGGAVSKRTSPVLHLVYRFVFLLSLFSVLIGLINLIPFPGLDGSVVLLDVVEAVQRKNLTRKGKALWISGALAVFYIAVFASNAPDMEGYYSFLIEKFTDAG